MDCEMNGGSRECKHLKFDQETNCYTCEHWDGDSCRNGELLQEEAEFRKVCFEDCFERLYDETLIKEKDCLEEYS